MRALHDVVQAGYARYIGMSSCWAWQCKLSSIVERLDIHSLRFFSSSPHHAEYVLHIIIHKHSGPLIFLELT